MEKLKAVYLPILSSLLIIALALVALSFAAREWYLAIDKEKVLFKWRDEKQKAVNLQAVFQKISNPYDEHVDAATLSYLIETPISLEGASFVERSWLLASRMGDTEGFDVLLAVTPDTTNKSDKVILVNAGWVANGSTYRGLRPNAVTERNNLTHWKVKITQVALNNSASEVLAESLQVQERFLKVQNVQTVIEALTEQYSQVYYSILLPSENRKESAVMVEQNEYTNAGFLYHFTPLIQGPEVHRAYAVQWLMLSFTVLIVFRFALVRRKGLIFNALE